MTIDNTILDDDLQIKGLFPVNVFKSDDGKLNKIPLCRHWPIHEMRLGEVDKHDNVGVSPPKGVVVFDLDTYKNPNLKNEIEAHLGEIDWGNSLLQKTPSGGEHHGFITTVDLPLKVNALGIIGFDIRSHGKSFIATGKGYTDETIYGVIRTLYYKELPMLTPSAISALQEDCEPFREDYSNDLEKILNERPLELDLSEIKSHVMSLPSNYYDDYQSWVEVGMSIHHETNGSLEGFEIYKDFSKQSLKYDEEACCDKWKSFNKSPSKRKLTMKSVIKAANTEKYKNQEGWWDQWVYVSSLDKFCSLVNCDNKMTRVAFNATYSREKEIKGQKTTAEKFVLQTIGIPVVNRTMYYPGKERIFEHEGLSNLNTYTPPIIKVPSFLNEEQTKAKNLFLKHFDVLFENEYEKSIVMDFLAYVYQNLSERIGWALVIQGEEGVGKGYLSEVMKVILNGSNVRFICPNDILSNFNNWCEGNKLIFCDEITVDGKNKYSAMEKIKPYITNDTLRVEKKGVDSHQTINFSSYVFFTNYMTALPIKKDNRRYCITSTRFRSKKELFDYFGGKDNSEVYFKSLYSSLKSHPEAIAYALEHHSISEKFNPKGHAPMTEAKKEMAWLTSPHDLDALEDNIEYYKCDVINEKIIDVTYFIKIILDNEPKHSLPKTSRLSNLLSEKGYKPIQNKRLTINKRKHTVYYDPSLIKCQEEVKDIVRTFHNCVEDKSEF